MPMKHTFALICIVVACGAAPVAFAGANGVYMAGYMGLKLPAANFSETAKYEPAPPPGKQFAGAMGLQLSPRWRVESELSYDIDDSQSMGFKESDNPLNQKMKSFAGLVSLYYDFDTHAKLKPFIGVGAGYANAFSESSEDQGALLGKVGMGLSYQASPTLSFTGAYNLIKDVPLGVSDFESDYGGHEIRFGMKYKLPYKPKVKPRPR